MYDPQTRPAANKQKAETRLRGGHSRSIRIRSDIPPSTAGNPNPHPKRALAVGSSKWASTQLVMDFFQLALCAPTKSSSMLAACTRTHKYGREVLLGLLGLCLCGRLMQARGLRHRGSSETDGPRTRIRVRVQVCEMRVDMPMYCNHRLGSFLLTLGHCHQLHT